MISGWQKKILILDGSTGTLLQQRGLTGSAPPETFCLEHPDVLTGIQSEYIAAGSDIIYTPTFGANRAKLGNYGLEKKTVELNRRLADLSLSVARPRQCLVAGDVGPTGLFFAPFGEAAFDQGLDIFTEQISALAAAGVDLIVIETQIDIQEARIALMAAREATRLPVLVSMTFDEHGRTLTGSDPLTCLNILQSLGAAAFGINCSTGPGAMLALLPGLASHARIPLLVKPNAGLPQVQDGKTVFPMEPADFAAFGEKFREAGVNLMGGCCGTTPEHIRRLAAGLAGLTPVPRRLEEGVLLLSSPRKTVVIGAGQPLRLVGERINPTNKPDLQAELSQGRLDLVKAFAQEQADQGADVLDVNVGAAGVDEEALMSAAVLELARLSELPLCLDSSRPETLAPALRQYPGRVLVNSLTGEKRKLEALLPLLQKYGAAFILLPLDDDGIPETLEERQDILTAVLQQCEDLGIPRGRAVVDGLALTVSANPAHARLSLRALAYTQQVLKLNTVLGLSNISFGLPSRPVLNSAFLAMAAGQGLSLVIANPADQLLQDFRRAVDLLTGRDPAGKNYLARFGRQAGPAAGDAKAAGGRAAKGSTLRELILKGEKEKLEAALRQLLEQGADPFALLTVELFPAIQEVGDKYQRREYFLPQLIASAEAMEGGSQLLAGHMRHERQASRGTVVLATVKGDVHDIGKKIVALMLRNNGFSVVDLGKSVDEQVIVEQAVAQRADIIGLSALMTTTMSEMPKVIALARRRCPQVKIMVGGAVVTQKFADDIGADGFAPDSIRAVELAHRLLRAAC